MGRRCLRYPLTHKAWGTEEKLTCPFLLHVVVHTTTGHLRTQERCGRTRTSGNPGQGVETPYNPLKQLAILVPLSILPKGLIFRVQNLPFPRAFLTPWGAGSGATLPESVAKLLSHRVGTVLFLKLIIEEGEGVRSSVYHVAGPGLAHVWDIDKLWEKQSVER